MAVADGTWADGAEITGGDAGWRRAWRRLRHNRPALVGLTVVALMFFTGIFAPYLAPYEYDAPHWDHVEEAPSSRFLLGTDELGRDLLSRIIWGARSACFVVVTVSLIGFMLGSFFGTLSGYVGGWVDVLIMRVGDVLFAFPGLLFVFLMAATIKPSLVAWVKAIGFRGLARSGYVDYLVVIIALGVVGWPGMARLIRGQILAFKRQEFIIAAEAMGMSTARVIIRHLLPNAMPPVIVAMSMSMGGIILSEATLSFLGIGLQPPNPSWGALLYNNWAFWRTRPYMLYIPGAALALVVFAFNFLGDGLNEAINPQLD